MIERVFDKEKFNAVCNDSRIRPWLGGPAGPLDFGPVLADTRNVLLMIDGGGVLFHYQEPTIYEAHTQFLPEVRGGHALRATLAAVEWMFLWTDCMEILTKAPEDNRAAGRWARLSGGTLRFERKDCWDGVEGRCGMEFYSLTLDEWKGKNAVMLAYEGRRFHDLLPDHGDHLSDSAHDCAVGAALLMAQHGQLLKAVVTYNRWARFAGYKEVQLVSQDPPILDLGTCRIGIVAGAVEVL